MIKTKIVQNFILILIAMMLSITSIVPASAAVEEEVADVTEEVGVGLSDLSEEDIEAIHQYNRNLENGIAVNATSREIETWAIIPTKRSGLVRVFSTCTVPGTTQYYTRLLQACLNKLGYNAGSEDGIYGANTKAAIIRFQKANSWLSVDGIAGENTWRCMDIRMDSIYPSVVDF